MQITEPPEALIDRIYESAFVPDAWPEVLVDCAKIAKARGGWMFVSNGDVRRWSASHAWARAILAPLVASGFIARSPRMARLLGARHNGFLLEDDIYAPEEWLKDPAFLRILRPIGLGWSTGTTFSLPTGDTMGVVLERAYDLGPVERDSVEQLDMLRPHLARSALMAARLQLERAQATAQVLEALGLAALVFDETGKVIAANPLIETMTGRVLWRAHDRLSLRDRHAEALLRAAIDSIASTEGGDVRSFPVRDTEGGSTMIAHVVPIRRSARDIFVRCAGVLALTPMSLPNAPPVGVVQSLFDLTPTEARVARDLAEGKTVADIALGSGASESTVRFHVRGVLEKTGCNRQTDVVALLTGISAMRPTPI
jgi:DNA-binding CsgD family transcriptional regulator